jgi:hypothetical protein
MGSASASASQTSDLRVDGISFEGHTAASNQNAFLAVCSTDLDVTFSLDVATPYEIIRFPMTQIAAFNASLTRGVTTLFSYGGTTFPNHELGTLDAGTYRFRVHLESTAPFSAPDWAHDSNIHFVFNIPAPGAAFALLLAGGMGLGRRRRSR